MDNTSSLAILRRDLGPDPVLETPARNNLLHIRWQLANLLLPDSAVLLRHNDLGPAHVPQKPPARAAGQRLLRVVLVGLAQPLHEAAHLDAQQRIVDAVAAEDVAEAARHNQWDLLGQEGSRCLKRRKKRVNIES